MADPKQINYLGGQTIDNSELVDQKIKRALEEAQGKTVGEIMLWPVSEKVVRQSVSDDPFEFELNGVTHSVHTESEPFELEISTHVPEDWHALDGTAELLASEHEELAAFMPDNVTNDGKIWLPYVKQNIIKIR